MQSVKTSVSTIGYPLSGEQHFGTVGVKKTICFNWLGIFVIGHCKSGSFLGEDCKKSLANAIEALHAHLDQGSNILVAQDFWYTKQHEDETVDSFVRRLRKTYQRAYRRDGLGQKHKTHCCMVISMKV